MKQLEETYHLPLFELLERSHEILKNNFDQEVQKCSLLSVKTGSCPEDCSYCPQSAHYKTDISKTKLMPMSEVKKSIANALSLGAQRFCMGAAWREVKDNKDFDQILDMIKEVKHSGMEACVTLGMLTQSQAKKLKEAGLDAYNHNLDSGREFYKKVISTRTYDQRLETISHVQKAGISVCSGGIIGMGESVKDRLEMLNELLNLEKTPESIPINLLIPVDGTPLEKSSAVPIMDLVKLIAVTRIFFPNSKIRLSAGRKDLSDEGQVLCFYAGANSLFIGEKLLTMDNPSIDKDLELINSF